MAKARTAKLGKGLGRFHAFLTKKSVGDIVDRSEILAETEWSESSFATYLRKNKLDPFLERLPGDRFRLIRAGSQLSESDVQGALSQVTPQVLVLRNSDVLTGQNGEYKLRRELGRGAVGHVWEAAEQSSGALVAVKVVNPRQDLLEPTAFANVKDRFHREARNSRRLSHDALVRYQDDGKFRGYPFLVMELAKESLRRVSETQSPLQFEEACTVVRSVARGLSFLHENGCIHRDVKPANILRCDRGFVLGDLGIVKWSDLNPAFTSAGTLTRASVQLGSWFYMAPEQQQAPHEAVPQSDAYALGVTWYELLTGRTATPAAFAAQQFSPPSANSNVNDMIKLLVRYTPAERASLDDVIRLLDDILK